MPIPVVLLHPFPFDSRAFAELRTALAGADLQLLTPDLHADLTGPGAGDRAPSVDFLADQVIALLDAQGIDRAVVGGVSMGGYVTLNLLGRYPQRLLGLILADTKPTADAPAAVVNRQQMAADADRGELPAAAGLLAGMVSPYTLDQRRDALEALSVVIETQSTADVAWKQRAMAARPDLSSVLAATELPALIIVGADDQITPPVIAREMARSAARSSLAIIEHCGHLAVAEDAPSVAAAIVEWIMDEGVGEGTEGDR